jgi:hypothetical protein
MRSLDKQHTLLVVYEEQIHRQQPGLERVMPPLPERVIFLPLREPKGEEGRLAQA